MRSSSDRESATYTRSALICFFCVGICLYFDIQKIRTIGFSFDMEFFISLIFYILLTALGIRSFLKGKKRKKDESSHKIK